MKVGEDMSQNNKKEINPFNEGIRIASIYFIVSSLWIYFSDMVALYLIGENGLDNLNVQTYKGVAFVAATSIMIYFLVKNSISRIKKLDKSLEEKIEEIDYKTSILKGIEEENKNLKNEIQYMGSFDSITGLPNRNRFQLEFNEKITDNSYLKVALLYIDIDNFAHINDLLGHKIGDVLLMDLSNRILKAVEKEDIVAKLQGDEFGITLHNFNSIEDLNKRIEFIQRAIDKPWKFENTEFYISSSIGVAIMPKDGSDFEILIKKAHIAMQYSKIYKKSGFHYYDDDVLKTVVDDVSIIDDVKKALQKNEFTLHYQIIQNMNTKSIFAVESLIRWFHPEKGYIPPLSFIPLAEKTDLIFHIRDFVVNEALSQKKKWKDKNINIPRIGINISLKSFCSADFVELIESKMKEYSIEEGELALELTESGTVDNMDNLISNLERFRELGVRISLDDFGTGYSSLARLKELSLDSIKMDKMFIDRIHIDKDDETMVKGVIHFAEGLGLDVIAEGIEHEEQVEKLLNLGCNLGQGYFIAKPMAANELEKLID